jgi:hypothetical protein
VTLNAQTYLEINAKKVLYTVLNTSEKTMHEETCMFHKTLSSKKRFMTYRVFQEESAIIQENIP